MTYIWQVNHMRALFSFVTMMLLLVLAMPAHAASFDCAKAVAADEVAVCRDGTTSALDSEMGGLFYAFEKVPMLMGANGARQDDAEAFLKTRAACGADITCLRRAYTARIAVLKENLAASMQQFSDLQNDVPPVTAAIPAGVETLIAGYAEQCKQLGGTLAAGADRPLTMSTDLDGDGVADYVLNPQNLQCSAGATAFCGNGGCQIDIAVSRDGFAAPIEAMGGTPTLVQSEAGTVARVWVDNTNCPKATADEACWATYAWADGKHTVTYAASPAPAM
jgi:uncharacterized protein